MRKAKNIPCQLWIGIGMHNNRPEWNAFIINVIDSTWAMSLLDTVQSSSVILGYIIMVIMLFCFNYVSYR